MKKFMKVCALVALVMIIGGLCLAVAAGSVAGAGTISQVVDDVTDGKIQVRLEGLTDWGLEVTDKITRHLGHHDIKVKYDINEGDMFAEDYEVLKGNVEKFCPGEGITRLNVELGGCTLEMQKSSDEKIYLAVENAYRFQSYVEDETLYIKGNIGSGTWNQLENFKVILYLPNGCSFETIDFEVGAGRVELEELTTRQANIRVGAGVIKIEGITAEEAELRVGAGQIEISDMVLDGLNAEVGMGELVAEGALRGDASIKCAMGNAELKLGGSEEEFNYNLEGAMGNITLGNHSYSGLANEKTIANGAGKNMDVECAMGNITISFQK